MVSFVLCDAGGTPSICEVQSLPVAQQSPHVPGEHLLVDAVLPVLQRIFSDSEFDLSAPEGRCAALARLLSLAPTWTALPEPGFLGDNKMQSPSLYLRRD